MKMREVLKENKKIFQKGNYNFNKKKKHIYLQESIDIFAKNIIKDLPFMSRYVTTKYNKYILNKYRDKLCRINNFLNSRSTKSDDLSQAFEKLNFIRIKIMLLERDINAYRNALRNNFDYKDTNMALQKRIHKKYAKLRKFDTYQNLNLAIIYDKSILGEKIKLYESEAKKNAERINKKFDSSENLQKMQKEFIYNIIIKRQNEDQIFIEDVDINTLQNLLKMNPKYINGLSNITTFTNEYLTQNPGALSKKFVKFKAEHRFSGINAIVKDYLNLYKETYPETTNKTLNDIQKALLSSFTYKDFKSSEIFNNIDTAISANDILLRAKINFAKTEMVDELKYCINLPEINNYFKIIENKDKIKNYVVSTERLFVKRIEEEFPEIKSSSFIYLYNNVKKLIEDYQSDIVATEQYFVNDFVNTVIYNEFQDPTNTDSVKDTLDNISVGEYNNPVCINSKNNFDLFCKLIIQFNYIKILKSIDFEKKLEKCKLFHGVLVTKNNQPILPLDIQTKIINMSLEAQINLARNYQNSSILELLDEFSVNDLGELKLGKQIIEFGVNSNTTIQRLSLSFQMAKLDNYIEINKNINELQDEVNLAKYISAGVSDKYKNSLISTITKEPIKEGSLFKFTEVYRDSPDETFEKPDIPDTNINEPEDVNIKPEDIEILDESKKKIQEVEHFKKTKKYIDLILKEPNKDNQSKMLLRIQKRINSQDLFLTEVQIDNLNEELNPLSLSLRSPKAYVDHLIEKYKTEKRDINSLQVGLKLRIRMGYLVLSNDEIEAINQENDFKLIQKSELKTTRKKETLAMKYILKGTISDKTKEKLENSEALVRHVIKKKSTKITLLDYELFKILED